MTKKPYSEQTLEELNKQKSLFTGVLAAFFIVWLIMVGLIIYIFVNKKPNYALLVVAFGLWPAMLPSVIGLSRINKEIKSRSPQS